MKAWIDSRSASGVPGVITCSALRGSYRERLRLTRPDIALVHVGGRQDVIEHRVKTRSGHFMPATLLQSQLDLLEPPGEDENPINVDATMPTDAQVKAVQHCLTRREMSR